MKFDQLINFRGKKQDIFKFSVSGNRFILIYRRMKQDEIFSNMKKYLQSYYHRIMFRHNQRYKIEV